MNFEEGRREKRGLETMMMTMWIGADAEAGADFNDQKENSAQAIPAAKTRARRRAEELRQNGQVRVWHW